MLRWIIATGSQFRFLIIVLAAALMVFGFVRVRAMPVDVLPEFSPPYVEIQTEALGLSAEEVEQMITVPMEQDLLSGVAWLDTIRSESVPGMSSIVVFFEPGTDLMQARQMVAERMTQAVALPHVSKPPIMLQPLSASSRVLIVGLSSKTLSPIQTSVLARWTIGPRLMGVPGVSNVAIWGLRDRQLQVQVNPQQLQARDVTLQQVLETTGNALWVSSLSFLEASTPGTGGFIDTPQQRLGVWHVSPISSAHELAKVPIEDSKLLLGDVANVIEDHQPLIGDAIANDNTSLFLIIEKLPGANTLEVTRGVEEALDAMAPGLSGVDIDSNIFRPASYIESAMNNLSRTLLIGLVLVIALLALFFRNWRVTLTAAISIVLSLAASVIVLHWQGATLNVMVLAGLMIALAVIIDDAIIDGENIGRRLRQFRRDGPRDLGLHRNTDSAVIMDALLETRSAAIFAVAAILITTVPVFVIQGIPGAFFQPMVQAYIIAVLTSLIVALLITTTFSLILLPSSIKVSEQTEPPLVRQLQQTYDRILKPILHTPRVAYIAIALLAIASLAILPFIGSQAQSLLPDFKESNLLIGIESAPGASHPAMVQLVNKASRDIKAILGVHSVGTTIGRAVFGDQKVGINSAQMWVSIDPTADYNATVARVREATKSNVGVMSNVKTYLTEKNQVLVSDPDETIFVRVFGENLGTLKDQAQLVQKAVAGVGGVAEAQVKLPVEEETIEIEVNLDAAQRYGLKPGDVRRTAAIMVSGLQVGSLFEDQKVFDVVVWSTPETRNSIDSVRNLLIDTPDGNRVRLAEVADVRMASSPNVIRRESISPYLDILFKLQGRSASAVAADIKTALKTLQFPLEYHAEVQGTYAAQQETVQRLLLAAAIAAIGILLLLQATFASWKLAWVVFLTVPLSLAGGILIALLTTGGVISVSVLAALALILVITIRNSTMLVSHCQNLMRQEGRSFSMELVLRGAHERVAPTVMTALAIALIFIPFLVFGNIPGHEIVFPMVFIVLGGLITSAVLTLLVIPVLFLRFENRTAGAGETQPSTMSAMPAK